MLTIIRKEHGEGWGGGRGEGMLCFFLADCSHAHQTQLAWHQEGTARELKVLAKRNKEMTFEGFLRYMASEDCMIFKNEHRTVYQDMSRPLNEYFISSSHNTYLISDQLIGPSHLWGYISALMKGCRCLEIDCWDGPSKEPVVYHGHTLTSKISFKTVIQVINKHAFLVSDYPLLLSLDNHCSPKQQEVIADYLISIFGDRLVTSTVDDRMPTQLPSPESLKFKIIIKNKKLGTLEETLAKKGTDSHGQTGEFEEEETSDEEQDDDPPQLKQPLLKKRQAHSKGSGPPWKKKRMKKIKIALALSELVIYGKSRKFVSFEESREKQLFYENNSIGEGKARKLAKQKANEFVQHTARFITRIYPKRTRTNSSNYNPQEFWNIGCQLVALNFQTSGVQMDLQAGKFLDNGGSGYILKPEYLRNKNTQFSPYELTENHHPVKLTIKLISGHQLPPSSVSRTNKADPVVVIEIYGIPEDQTKQHSCVVKGNGPAVGSESGSHSLELDLQSQEEEEEEEEENGLCGLRPASLLFFCFDSSTSKEKKTAEKCSGKAKQSKQQENSNSAACLGLPCHHTSQQLFFFRSRAVKTKTQL
ncbi:hypothetical protein JRQ81_015398 [Phrynocephalus forsythii]|uniref:Phosphoinositide phospholipase C n=1 Tax=Phrynocephalus forsythii TaxID=171643 RepID=A0A9Q1B245_9SAUR|nr:hypothetical protein JRQ81_015398 [Phrynocephalus forsythii]